MKLYDILKLSGSEMVVCDRDYDMEAYFYGEQFYNGLEPSLWDQAMLDLSKLLEVTHISMDGITVNLSGLIEQNMSRSARIALFGRSPLCAIMDDMPCILSGFVTESWMREFVNTLKPLEGGEHHAESATGS